MSFTTPRQLIVAALIAGMLAHLGFRLGYSSLPPLPPLSGVTLLALAVIDGVLALVLRPRIRRRPGTERVDALTAGRAVALAKASSLVGAIMGGAWLGLLAYLLPRYSMAEAVKADMAPTIIGLVSAAALVAAGLWLEDCLRNPDEPEEPDESEQR